ncbi:MAG: HRDC domain-containing protein [Deltaproteobacteria bacterium]|nr:HRDC domain-containing protein [Deltaproteobacteria bacterium]
MAENRFSYEWIETAPRLKEMARILGQSEIIGVDLESDSFYHYYEKVCLLQIATESASYVLETLALRDLSVLGPAFSNPGIRKVFHGADYDIRSLDRDFRLKVNNLFDTQLACQFLGLPETGLEAVLRNRFQVELNKKFQRADWSRRPLSREMVEYAALDTQYLIPLAREMERELEEKGRLLWVEEECRSLTKVRFNPPSSAPLYLKVKGAGRLDPWSLAVLEALLEFREIQAQKSDLPPFKVIRNEPLLELALKKPLSLEEMETGKAMSRKEIDRYGRHLLRGIARALALPEKDLPLYPREARPDWPKAVRDRIKALKNWRDQRAKGLNIEPGILMNNVLINALALKNPRSLKEMEEIPGLKKWFKDHFGREILAVQTEERENKKIRDTFGI